MAGTSDDPNSGAATAAVKKASPGMPWGQAETFHLIDAYEEHCLSLKRRQLKAQEWEAVAAEVSDRTGTGGMDQLAAKSGTQCRHKIEKLRKRFKAESARPVRSFWPFFERMGRLEHGPVQIPASAPSDDDDDEDASASAVSNIKSINAIVKSKLKEDNEENGEVPTLSMTEVMQGFAEEVSKMEKRQTEIMREIATDRTEMESKREKMITETQRYLVECISDVFRGRKKAKISHNLFQ